MTPTQQELIKQLRLAVEGTASRRIVYQTEYLGYLPFGKYHWITVADQDVSLKCPEGWCWQDLEALADAGELVRISNWINPHDELERVSHYDLVPGGD